MQLTHTLQPGALRRFIGSEFSQILSGLALFEMGGKRYQVQSIFLLENFRIKALFTQILRKVLRIRFNGKRAGNQ
jgi:hypothetical protein